MNKFILILVFLGVIFSNCQRKGKDSKLFYLLGYYILNNQTNNVLFKAKIPSINLNKRNNLINLQGITDIVAISSANHYIRTKVDSGGNFFLNLPKGYQFIIIFLDSSNKVKGYYSINDLSMNAIPTHYAGNELEGGNLGEGLVTNGEYSSIVPISFDKDKFLSQAGDLTIKDVDSIKFTGDQILNLINTDADGNGVDDLLENLYTRASFVITWGSSDNINIRVKDMENKFNDLSNFKKITPRYQFQFNIDSSKLPGINGIVEYPIPSNCIDSNNGQMAFSIPNNFTQIPGPGLIKAGKGFITSLNFTCGNKSRTLPTNGEYVVKFPTKTFKYNHLIPAEFSVDSILILPSIKINVSDDLIDSIEYIYKRINRDGTVIDASDKDLKMTYGNSIYGSGLICNETNAISGIFGFNCGVPNNSLSGTLTECNSSKDVKYSNPKGTKFSGYSNCLFFGNDSYGTTFFYSFVN
jgi:hypothetical protein